MGGCGPVYSAGEMWCRTEDMNRPKRPPRPKPITPAMPIFTGHDSKAAVICAEENALACCFGAEGVIL